MQLCLQSAFTRLRLVGCQTQSDNVVEARTSFRKERSPCLNEPLMVASTGVAHSERLINSFDIFNLNEKQREFPAPPWAGVKRVTPAPVPSLRYTVQPLPPTPLPSRRSHGVPTPTLPESATPQIRLPNFGIPLQQLLTRIRLELPSDVRRTVFWVCVHKQLYVVVFVRDLQRQNLVSEVVRSGPQSPQTTLAHRPPLHPEPGVDTLGTRRSDTYRN